jgi:hypothetical protein
MIEMRIVEIGDGCRPEIQYRHHLFATNTSVNRCPPDYEEWSDWKTAPYVKAEEIENE